jgi:hypothetical protein
VHHRFGKAADEFFNTLKELFQTKDCVVPICFFIDIHQVCV